MCLAPVSFLSYHFPVMLIVIIIRNETLGILVQKLNSLYFEKQGNYTMMLQQRLVRVMDKIMSVMALMALLL